MDKRSTNNHPEEARIYWRSGLPPRGTPIDGHSRGSNVTFSPPFKGCRIHTSRPRILLPPQGEGWEGDGVDDEPKNETPSPPQPSP